MQCPYCAEEIKERANHCRYCGHDLSFFKATGPMLERMSSLEDRLSSLEDQVSSLKNQISEGQSSTSPKSVPPVRRGSAAGGVLALVLIASLMTSFILSDVLIRTNMSAEEQLQIIHSNPLGWHLDWTDILFIGAPLIAGWWLRVKLHQKRIGPYIILGVFVGVITEAAMVLLGYTVLHPTFVTIEDEIVGGFVSLGDLLILARGIGVNVAAITMLLVSGGMFGGLFDAWRSKRPITEDATISKEVVKKVLSPDSQYYEAVLKILTAFYAPTIAFAGALLPLYFAR